MHSNIREKPFFFPVLLEIETRVYIFVLCLYFKYYRSISVFSLMKKSRTKQVLFPSMAFCGLSVLLGTVDMMIELYSVADYLLWLNVKLSSLILSFDIEFCIWQLKQIFFFFLVLHFFVRQELTTVKVIRRHYIDDQNLKKRVADSFNYDIKFFVISKKFSINENLNLLNIESLPLSDVSRIDSQIAKHVSKEMHLNINNIDLTDVKTYNNSHHMSVLPTQNSFSFNVSSKSSNILLILFIVFDQLNPNAQNQNTKNKDFSSRVLITQNFKNGKSVQGVTEILLAEYSFF